MRITENGIEDNGVSIRAKGEVRAGEAMGVEIGVLDEDGLVGGDRIVLQDIQLAGRKIVDEVFDPF